MEQHSVAEARTREAEFEREKDRRRYRDVRALASSLLFDLYDGVRDLAGSAMARRLIVSKVQRQLEVLNADGGNDIGLQRDLAACYERMGELQVDPGRPGEKRRRRRARFLSEGSGAPAENRRNRPARCRRTAATWR